MAEKGEKRDPTSHRTPTQQRRHTRGYNARPDQVANRSKQNQARRMLEKEGVVQKGDGKDVHHKKPLDKGGTNARSNLTVTTPAKNRGHGMANQHTKKR
jgi:hypothetical protein